MRQTETSTRTRHLCRPCTTLPLPPLLTCRRKHTGERPFQCHCSRRFSRLDNLRQHAQTVHVNEDIPLDSLAATGSRFQRQMRTDRVRQAGNRARASTSGSAGGPQRGHSKSLSTSSINSIGSIASTYSTAADARRRPPPLVMADPRGRPGDHYRNGDAPFQYRPPSPSEFGTPTSATFSTGQGSPRWASGMASPATSHSRSQSMYSSSGARTPGRRLSVPSAVHVFQSPPGPLPARPMFGPAPVNSANNGVFTSAPGPVVTSPTLSTGLSARRDSTSSASEDWRRRTWHPDSRMYTQNQLSNVANQSSMRPNPPPPIANPSNTQSTLQLPGIESFDQPGHHQHGGPMTPPRQHQSPMMPDSQTRPREMDERRNLNAYDASIQRGLNRLDISPNTPPRERAAAWAADVSKTAQVQLESARSNAPMVRFEGHHQPAHYTAGPPQSGHGRSFHQHTMSAPSLVSSRESKRRGWYNGPLTVHQEEEGQQHQQQQQRPAQDPRVARVERMVHPNFTGFSGFPTREQEPGAPQQQQAQPPTPQQQTHQYQPQQYPQQAHANQQPPPQGQPQNQQRPSNGGDQLGRLEALVAVATSEGSTATAAY